MKNTITKLIYLLGVLLFLLLASCSLESNGEIQLRHLKNQCHYEHVYSMPIPGLYELGIKCNGRVYYLVNKSKDKVIKFTVCKEDEKGKVDYSEHILEPTGEALLGCKCKDWDVYKMYVKSALLIKSY